MKKLILLIALFVGLGSTVKAQQTPYFYLKSNVNKNSDTITNATAVDLSIKTANFYDYVTIQARVTKISGTTAGKVTLLGSLDGVNYVRINLTDSLNLANVTTVQTKVFVVAGAPYNFFRINSTGSGTQSTRIDAVAAIFLRGASPQR